jgi:hypothetical protein
MRKEGVAAVVAILVSASLGIGYLSGNSARGTETITSTSTLTSLRTITLTTTSASAKNTTSVLGLNGTTLQVHVPWSGIGTLFLGANPLGGGGPALVENLTQVVVFDCASQAATAQGCTQEVNASVSSAYQVTIWYPFSPVQGEYWTSGANCAFSSPTTANPKAPVYPSYCIPVGANGFIVAMPQPGPG